MEGEEYVFFVVFIDLEGNDPLPTYPQVESKSCSSPKNFIW